MENILNLIMFIDYIICFFHFFTLICFNLRKVLFLYKMIGVNAGEEIRALLLCIKLTTDDLVYNLNSFLQGKGFEPQFTGMIFIDIKRFTPVGIKE